MKTSELFVSLIKFALCGGDNGEKLSGELNSDVLPTLFSLAKAHDVTNILADALLKLKISLDDETAQRIKIEKLTEINRYEQMNYELERVSELFESEKLDFLPLKGAVIRKFYPREEMRTSCDIDILVKEKDLKRAQKLLCEKLNFTFEENNSHDVSFFSEGGTHLELHFDLIEEQLSVSFDLNSVWQNAVLVENKSYHYKMTNEQFVCYHIAHMAKHFSLSGTGVRSIMDLYVIKTRFEIDNNVLENLLKKFKLLKFYQQMNALMECWFFDRVKTNELCEIEEFILNSGVYGNNVQHITAQKAKKQSKFKYMLTRLFPSYNSMTLSYPVLKKWKILLPLFYIIRFFRAVFSRRIANVPNEMKNFDNISQEDLQKYNRIKKNCGL